MNTLLNGLPMQDLANLRHQFQLTEPTAWVVELAHQKSWREANEQFLKHERARGRQEMDHLMSAAGRETPLTPEGAADLVAAAVMLYVSAEDLGDCVERTGPGSVRVRICNCPTYRRIEASNWRGVTACGSSHRRRGWYDALGLYPEDSLIAESKWGDEACEALIEFS